MVQLVGVFFWWLAVAIALRLGRELQSRGTSEDRTVFLTVSVAMAVAFAPAAWFLVWAWTDGCAPNCWALPIWPF